MFVKIYAMTVAQAKQMAQELAERLGRQFTYQRTGNDFTGYDFLMEEDSLGRPDSDIL